jgi:hypothetical protein
MSIEIFKHYCNPNVILLINTHKNGKQLKQQQ